MHIKGIKIAYAIIASFLRSLAALRPLGCGSGLYAFEGFTVWETVRRYAFSADVQEISKQEASKMRYNILFSKDLQCILTPATNTVTRSCMFIVEHVLSTILNFLMV